MKALFLLLGLLAVLLATVCGDGSSPYVLDLSLVRWAVKNANGSIGVKDISIPSQIQTVLYRAGIVDYPYYRYNDVNLRWVALDEWTYSCVFFPEQKFSRFVLVAHGLDTVADITLNGKFIAQFE